jgi:hypothetical protein
MMDETYTAEQLRERARNLRANGHPMGAHECEAHADALEENARLKERVALDDTEREYRRQSLANEIRETLKVRGHFAAERPSDLIGCVARAIESERERAERAENALATMRPFFDKHALGALAKPSCLCCGRNDYKSVAVQHAELPAIVICDRCKCAEAELAKLRQHAEAMAGDLDRFAAQPDYDGPLYGPMPSLIAYRADFPEEK